MVLSGLYMATERYQEAMGVHEEILRLLLVRDNGSDQAQTSLEAKKHLDQLRQTAQRAGSWLGSFPRYSELSQQLIREFGNEIGWKDVLPLQDVPPILSPTAKVVTGLEATQREERRISPFRARSRQRGRI